MDVNRRNLMKGMLTGGALLALGIPGAATTTFAGSLPGKSRSCVLLLGNTRVDDAFARGAAAAYAACSGQWAHLEAELAELQAVKLKGGLLVEMDRVSELLALSRDTRWIVVMDDASAAVFTEMARNAGVRLLSRGSHVSSRIDSAYPAFPPFQAHGASGSPALRHLWTSASHGHSAGAILASKLIRDHNSFSIVENFLGETANDGGMTAGYQSGQVYMTSGFRPYRLAGPGEMYLHCSGVSPSEGCKLLGWDTAEGWTQFPDVGEHEPARQTTNGDWQPASWVESLGYALTITALEMREEQAFWTSRGFVHRASHGNYGKQGNPGEGVFLEERFSSFIIDI